MRDRKWNKKEGRLSSYSTEDEGDFTVVLNNKEQIASVFK